MKAMKRLPSETVEFTLGATADSPGHHFTMCLARDPETGEVREVNFVGRGKVGHGIDLMFHELGIKLSRALQGRDLETGEER